MFKQYLKDEYPFATKFFEAALSQSGSKFFHSFLLTGSNPYAQYDLALEVARYLNCQNKENFESCDCLNCRWIKENRHPAVITVSPIDYLEGNSDGKAKSVISVDQIRHLKNALSMTSPYHRIIIFTGASEETPQKPLSFAPPAIVKDEEQRNWTPYGLSQKIFKASAANAILKSIEEPNDKVTFFFLTSNKEDILPTIISRSQCVNVVSSKIEEINTEPILQLLNKLPPKSEAQALILAQDFLNLSKDYSIEQLLDMMSEHFKKVLEQNIVNEKAAFQIIEIVKKIHEAKLRALSYVSPQGLLEALFLGLIKR